MIDIPIAYTDQADRNLPLPSYETQAAAGMDLRANFPVEQRGGIALPPNARMLIPTGLRLAIPTGYEAQIRPRSGLALKHGISLPNTPGTIDSDYRGALGVILINLGQDTVQINHGDRIAQMVIAPVIQAHLTLCDTLEDTKRGAKGFGSTGRA